MLSKVCSIRRWKVFRTWHVEGHGEQVHSWFGSHCGLLTFGRWMGDVIKARWVVGSFPQLLSLSKRKTGTQSGEDWLLAFTCMPHIIVLCFIVFQRYFIFYKLKIFGNPALGKSISAMFLMAFVHLVSLSHILVIQYFKRLHDPWKWKWSCSGMSDSLWSRGLEPTTLLHPWDFPGKSTGVGCHFLLQRIFPTQGSNPCLPHYGQTFYPLSHQGITISNHRTAIKCEVWRIKW